MISTLSACKNNGNNNLHGGNIGFGKRVWEGKAIDKAEPSLVLTLVSEDGDEGFPGSIDVTVTYTVTNNNSLVINYSAKSDEDTICNMTNHSLAEWAVFFRKKK